MEAHVISEIPLRFSYTETFVRAGYRRAKSQMQVWSDVPASISIRTVDPVALQPAYRIHQAKGSQRSFYLVHSFEERSGGR